MSAHPPPVPPANRSPKGTGGDPKPGAPDVDPRAEPPENAAERDRQGNIRQNTRNQGYQQDR